MIMHIVGNRPQFIKLAAVSKEIRKRGYEEIIIHTGQHYDANMSDIFFEELEIAIPNENLAIGSGTHAEMTGKAMIAIEKILQLYSPKCVVLYGDTDSTLAGAMAAAKCKIPIVHVEAGIRTGKLDNPEEVNRIVTDHVSTILFCSDREGVVNLRKEGMEHNVFQVGDVMYDTFLQQQGKQEKEVLTAYDIVDDGYVLMTWHRQENTETKEKMIQILNFVNKVPYPVICPMHPRTKAKLKEFGLWERLSITGNLRVIDPVGYLEMIKLMSSAHIIITDSGGVSKESYFAGVKCVLMVELNLWSDLVEKNWIRKLDILDEKSIEQAHAFIVMSKSEVQTEHVPLYGSGNAATKIVDILEQKNMIY